MHMNYCSSREYLRYTLLFPILVHVVAINKPVIIENTNTVHNILIIQTGTIQFLNRHQFLPIFYVSSHESKIVKAHVR